MSPAETFAAAKSALFRWRDENAPGTHACVRLECWQHPGYNGETETTLTLTVATPTGIIATAETSNDDIHAALGCLDADKADRKAALDKVRVDNAETAMAEKGVA